MYTWPLQKARSLLILRLAAEVEETEEMEVEEAVVLVVDRVVQVVLVVDRGVQVAPTVRMVILLVALLEVLQEVAMMIQDQAIHRLALLRWCRVHLL